MNKASLVDIFFADKQPLLVAIKIFEQKFNVNLLGKLAAEKDKTTFLSAITEIHYGLFFGQSASKIYYEHKSFPNSLLTPDWFFTSNDQRIIAEVLRMNAAQEDQEEADFIEVISDCLVDIKLGYTLYVDFAHELAADNNLDVQNFRREVNRWLLSMPAINDMQLIEGIELEILQIDNTLTHVCISSKFSQVVYRPQRLHGLNSGFYIKLNKYAEQVKKNNFPFIICMYLHFESWFHLKDIFHFLYGHDTTYIDEFEFDSLEYGWKFQEIQQGIFYNNELAKECLSGVLIRHNDSYTYFHNYFHQNRLNTSNANWLKQYEYSYK